MFFRSQKTDTDEQWREKVLEKLVLHAVREQRASRRWSIFFKMAFLLYLLAALLVFLPALPTANNNAVHVAKIDIQGMIAAGAKSNAEDIIASLRQAFSNNKAKAIILNINSPGGSAVQSDDINQAIQALRQQWPEKKIYAVISDVGASGAYYIAAATDAIYANPSSLVGSIGVLYNGFGFTDAMAKLGVERRLLTAGENKVMLDPFLAMQEKDQQHLQQMLDEIHQTFISRVKEGRGQRLQAAAEELIFSGMAWTGVRAQQFGLIDGFASLNTVAAEIIGVQEIVDYSMAESVLDRLGLKVKSSLADYLQTTLGSLSSSIQMLAS